MRNDMFAIVAVALVGAASPAFAQTATHNINSRADCLENFRIVDDNRDGYIDRYERAFFPNAVPTQLLTYDVIQRQTYLRACRQLISTDVK